MCLDRENFEELSKVKDDFQNLEQNYQNIINDLNSEKSIMQ